MLVHLVRHGEVANPNHVVYGDLPGFNLSPRGVRQANAAAHHLAMRPITRVVASPLARAVQTATAIARRHGIDVEVDDRLLETRQFTHWTGLRWEDVRSSHRDEYVAYLRDATSAPATGEDIHAVADRAVAAIHAGLPDSGDLVVVGHQDTTQAARLAITGRSLSGLREHPPRHAAVITVEPPANHPHGAWAEVSSWAPEVP